LERWCWDIGEQIGVGVFLAELKFLLNLGFVAGRKKLKRRGSKFWRSDEDHCDIVVESACGSRGRVVNVSQCVGCVSLGVFPSPSREGIHSVCVADYSWTDSSWTTSVG